MIHDGLGDWRGVKFKCRAGHFVPTRRAAISAELGQLSGPAGGDFIKSILERSSDPGSGTLATILEVLTVLVAASGVFGEMHTALNATFKAKASDEPIFFPRSGPARRALGSSRRLVSSGRVVGGEHCAIRLGACLSSSVRRQDPFGGP
jgi:hypothetical protein